MNSKYTISNPRYLCSAIAIALSSQTMAQETTQQADIPKKSEAKLETIVVTAQKRSQNLQEVPLSVSAINGEKLQQSVVKDVFDLQTNVPGLAISQSQSANSARFSIRGIGTNGQNFGLESSVGLYVDGVYRPRPNSLVNNMVDLEAAEVLRGPQGTLFGKNTPAGSILMRSVAPSHNGDGFIEATLGNYGLVNFSGAKSISAIDDVLAFRVTGFSSDRDGIMSDVNLGDNVINDRNRWGGRAQALFTPSEGISLRVIADYAELDEVCCGAMTTTSNFEATDIPGKYGSDALLSLPPVSAPYGTGDQFFDLNTTLSTLPMTEMKDRGLSAELHWDLTKNAQLVSISAYRDFDTTDIVDTDFSAADLFMSTNIAQQSSFSQELRIDYTSDKYNAILGVFYFSQALDLDYRFTVGDDFESYFYAGAPEIVPLIEGINDLSAATQGAIAPVASATPSGSSFDHVAEQEHSSYALFGQVDYKFNENWIVTAGLRYTDETKDMVTTFTESIADGPFPDTQADPTAAITSLLTTTAVLQAGGQPTAEQVAGLVPFQSAGWGYALINSPASLPRSDIDVTLKDDRLTGTLKISYQPDSNTMFYASYGTGYKSGGTNTDRIDEQFDPVFEAETTRAFEVGMKKDFPENAVRINTALHITNVSDFQASTFNGLAFNLQNAGDIETSGAELEVTWLPTDTLEVNVGYSYVKAEFESFDQGTCWVGYTWHTGIDDPGRANPDDLFCDGAGLRLGGQPEHQLVLQLRQEYEINADIYADFTAEYAYTSDMEMDNNNDPFKHQDAYGVLNLRVNVHFENIDTQVIFWGRNVLDEEYYNGEAFDAPLQEGKVMSHPGEPATFGVTVTKRF